MKIKLLNIISLSLLLISNSLIGQQGDGGNPKSFLFKTDNSNIVTYRFNEPDISSLRIEDSITEIYKSGPWRFGFNNSVNLNMNNSGSWTTYPDGSKVWRLKVNCENALSINLTLDNVIIPEGNELYVYNEQRDFILGKFTDYHLYEGQLGTELVPGNTAIIEYYIAPKNKNNEAQLNINTVTHGYRTTTEFQEKAFGSSGNCNMNANCSDADPWELQKRSAVMLVSGSNGFCTGALINNSQNDGKPYVLTANHCGTNPTSWVFRFNWQAAPEDINQSDCTIDPSSSPSYSSLSGAVLRANRYPSDFSLVEITGGLINGTVPNSYGAFFAGWDNSDNIPTSAFCFHHPRGDIKKVSFDDAPLVSANGMGSTEDDSQWEVEWDRGTTTEGGSSGSPLFDQNGRIIGQLWGGGASCFNLSEPDFYGKFSYSWNPAGSNSTNQLKYWLDPNDDGLVVLDGYFPTASVKKIDFDIEFSVYPNPNKGEFTVKLNQNAIGNSSIKITDLSGRIIYQSIVSNSQFEVKLLNVTSGNYFIEIENNNQSTVKRLSIL